VIRLSPILDTGRVKVGNQDPEAYRQRLEAKLRPERIRATLGFAGLYQMTHELIKTAVLDEVREFYWRGIEDGVVIYDEQGHPPGAAQRRPYLGSGRSRGRQEVSSHARRTFGIRWTAGLCALSVCLCWWGPRR
jgi:hypothetical protein